MVASMDNLSLSLWLARSQKSNRVRQFEKLLQLFPFSQRPQPQSVISVYGVSATEPPLLERSMNGPLDPADVLPIFQDYSGSDIAFEVETWWDLWQFEEDWKLAPSRIALSCFGPEFEHTATESKNIPEDLRIDFGVDIHFLPQPEITGSSRLVESNIKSLLRLVHELDSALALEKRQLETESGENFALRLQSVLTSGA
jgi:hypothetical protein